MPLRLLAATVDITCCLAAALLLNGEAVLADTQPTFHVSPDGNDDNRGDGARPFATIQKARDAVRAINRDRTDDIVIAIHGGTYRLAETVRFDARDSGTGGHDVIYKAHEGQEVILSGGKVITGWQPAVDGRWKAPCGENFRQLYVDGRRAVRARSEETKGKTEHWFQLDILPVPGIAFFGDNSYQTTDVTMADWRNAQDVEFCYYAGWCHTRCKVDSIVRAGSQAVIRMAQPQFMLARRKEGLRATLPNYIENALELLDRPGEWYLDRSDRTLYYMPRQGEAMAKVEVIVPVLEKLVELRGQLDAPVEHLQFHGITFSHATWREPSRNGFPDVQANFVQHMLNLIERGGNVNNVHNEDLKSPANIVCRMVKHVIFKRCVFTHLGGAGIDVEYGSQGNVVEGCHFHDISGTAIQIGGVERSDHHPGDARTAVRNNQVLNNLIENCAVEYMGGLGVFVGYTDSTTVAHNEIRNLPYSGISVGWGWGEEDAGGGWDEYYQPYRYRTPTVANHNRIENNHIHHVMTKLVDGGGVYTLGNMPRTIIRGNHVHDNLGVPGGIYLDEGSGFIEIANNVVYHVQRPMNYNNKHQNRFATCNEHDNWFSKTLNSDSEIQSVIDSAGLTPEYRAMLDH